MLPLSPLWLSEFARKVKTYVLEIILRHLQYVARVSQEYIPTLAVAGHVLVFAFLEGLQFGSIIAFDPTGLVEADGLPPALGVVFVLQAILYDFELQLAHRADDFAAVELIDK